MYGKVLSSYLLFFKFYTENNNKLINEQIQTNLKHDKWTKHSIQETHFVQHKNI